MSLIKWEPFDDFDRFFRELAPFSPLRAGSMGFDMAVDVYEDGKDIVAEMNIPGLSADAIDVEVEDNYLRIAGRREEVQEKKGKNHYAKEIRRGSFERVVQLPDAVDQDKVTAEYKDGVLKVRMPKRETAPEKKVKVTVK
jgi:HSP20 family protein